MNSGWCMKSIFSGASHLVVSDVKPAAFGYGGRSYWRETIGCQESFNCRDFQQETRTVTWGLPCIWTCNFDNDPRKDRAVAQYIKTVSYVCVIRDRDGERCWGKLYTPDKAGVEETETEDWIKAIAYMQWFDAGEEIDEAVDIGNEFGI